MLGELSGRSNRRPTPAARDSAREGLPPVVPNEWDDAKAARNLALHRVGSELVREFDGDTAVIRSDARRVCGEPRLAAHGPIGDRLDCLVFTPRGEVLRVISLHKANRREVRSDGELDPDILAAFRATGRGWQARINSALREWLSRHGASGVCKQPRDLDRHR